MKNYNLVMIENTQCVPFLNLTEQAFYDKLWEWTYEDDLWDYIDENVFHKYEEDDVTCFAFVTTDKGIVEYEISEGLFDFIKSKIEEHYD